MLIRKIFVWSLERVTELLAGALLALAIYGPSNFPPGATPIEEIRVNLFGVGFFYVASGYVVSCVGFGLLFLRREPLLHGAVMAALFIAHGLMFFLLIAQGGSLPLYPIAGGAVIVFLINAVGTTGLGTPQHWDNSGDTILN